MMFYRLLAINIDGTLLTSSRRLTREVKEAIDFVKSRDVYVTLYTSRNFSSAQKVAKALNLDIPIITHSGAIVAHEIEKPFYASYISEDDTYDIVKALEYYDCNIRLSTEQFAIGNRKRLQSNLIAKAVFSTSDPIFYPVQFVEKLSETLKEQLVKTPKIELHFIDEDEKEDAMMMLKQEFNHLVSVGSEEEYKVEVLPKGVSRLNSLSRLASHYKIKLEEIVAVGDSKWDKEVISNVGLGVAMGNAPFEVKQASKWVTRTNNQNGLSYMIIEHFRKQFPFAFLKNHIDSESIRE